MAAMGVQGRCRFSYHQFRAQRRVDEGGPRRRIEFETGSAGSNAAMQRRCGMATEVMAWESPLSDLGIRVLAGVRDTLPIGLGGFKAGRWNPSSFVEGKSLACTEWKNPLPSFSQMKRRRFENGSSTTRSEMPSWLISREAIAREWRFEAKVRLRVRRERRWTSM